MSLFTLQTPAFMPVGTQGTVKAMTFHLYLRYDDLRQSRRHRRDRTAAHRLRCLCEEADSS
ncbi:hypothetical protein [Armatimonas sp.]|uniref:hypothetical protein n=1 Tax=Armatimonas sp. TaxID=1872638 RepID=UPI003753B98F